MSVHAHLKTEVAKTRYAMASYWLALADHIVEIGGAVSPINTFLPEGSFNSCVTIDPNAEQRTEITHGCNGCGRVGSVIHHQKAMFQNINIPEMLNEYRKGETVGVCMMGVELLCSDEEIQMLYPLIERTDILVLEHVITNELASQQVPLFEEWAMAEGKQKAVELTSKFEYDAGYRMGINSSFHKTRRFVVYVDKEMPY